MPASPRAAWRNRWEVGRAAVALTFAQLLVKNASLARVRSTLATREGKGLRRPDLATARSVGRRVERAASRLPFRTKCLPRAVAAKWLLDRHGLASRLVIAVHRHDRAGDHAFHAWVEHDGEIVIGHCVRADYAPVMAIGVPQGG